MALLRHALAQLVKKASRSGFVLGLLERLQRAGQDRPHPATFLRHGQGAVDRSAAKGRPSNSSIIAWDNSSNFARSSLVHQLASRTVFVKLGKRWDRKRRNFMRETAPTAPCSWRSGLLQLVEKSGWRRGKGCCCW